MLAGPDAAEPGIASELADYPSMSVLGFELVETLLGEERQD
ncbi:hypothetical protein [Microbacterium testaceum]|nr:hypothetical protein [Microbacterium testaceum]